MALRTEAGIRRERAERGAQPVTSPMVAVGEDARKLRLCPGGWGYEVADRRTKEVHVGIIWWLIIGLIAGALARFLVPGRDPMGLLATLLLGLVGSLIGAFIATLFTDRTFDEFNPSGLIGSIIGAVIALLIWRAVSRRRGATYR